MKSILVVLGLVSIPALACLDVPMETICMNKQYAFNCLRGQKEGGQEMVKALVICHRSLQRILKIDNDPIEKRKGTDDDVLSVINAVYNQGER